MYLGPLFALGILDKLVFFVAVNFFPGGEAINDRHSKNPAPRNGAAVALRGLSITIIP